MSNYKIFFPFLSNITHAIKIFSQYGLMQWVAINIKNRVLDFLAENITSKVPLKSIAPASANRKRYSYPHSHFSKPWHFALSDKQP